VFGAGKNATKKQGVQNLIAENFANERGFLKINPRKSAYFVAEDFFLSL
jgi:hypothetical protein